MCEISEEQTKRKVDSLVAPVVDQDAINQIRQELKNMYEGAIIIKVIERSMLHATSHLSSGCLENNIDINS